MWDEVWGCGEWCGKKIVEGEHIGCSRSCRSDVHDLLHCFVHGLITQEIYSGLILFLLVLSLRIFPSSMKSEAYSKQQDELNIRDNIA